MSLFSCCGYGDGDRTNSQEDLKAGNPRKDRSAMSDGAVVAVVLSGCGFLDGSDVHEVAHVCAAVEKRGAKIKFYAPDSRQKDEVNHKTNESNKDTERGTLIESARIARGNIESLADLNADGGASAVIVPGGFGAAKNLSSFAFESDSDVEQEVKDVLRGFHAAGRPMAFTSIAAILPPMVLTKQDGVTVKVTLGQRGEGWPYAGTIDSAVELGAEVEELEPDQICIDDVNKIVSAPLFMKQDARFDEVAIGADNLVEALLGML